MWYNQLPERMSLPEVTGPVAPAPIQPQPDAAAGRSGAGSFKDAPVTIVASGEYQLSSEEDDYVEIIPQTAKQVDDTLIKKALTGARAGGLLQPLKIAARALVNFFDSIKPPASRDIKTLVNLETLAQLQASNQKANSSLSRFLSPQNTPDELAKAIKKDPGLLRDITGFASSLGRLAKSPKAVERMIAAKNPGLAPEIQKKLAGDFLEAAQLLRQLYQARFDPQDPNTAFAKFGEKKNNPFEQLIARQDSTFGDTVQIRNWAAYAIGYFEQCSQIMVDSVDNQDPEIDIGELRKDMETFINRPAGDKLYFGRQHLA